MSRMLESVDDIPMNFGFLGKGNDFHPSSSYARSNRSKLVLGVKGSRGLGDNAGSLGRVAQSR